MSIKPQHGDNGKIVGRTRARVMADKAFVFLELDRKSGQITVDDSFATPLESWAMLWHASERAGEQWRPPTE